MKLNIFSFLFVFLILSTSVFAEVAVSLNDDASVTNDLVCSFTGDGYEREWILNGMVQDQFKNQERIDASNLVKNDVWTCNVYSFRVGRYTFDRLLEGSDTATVLNSAPVIVSTEITSALPGSSYNYDVDAFDADGDSLTYSLVQSPVGMAIDAQTGLIIWTAVSGSHFVVVSVTDGDSIVTQSFTVNVGGQLNVNANAVPTNGCSPLQVQLSAAVTGGNGDYTYSWDFTNDGDYEQFGQSQLETYTTGTYLARVYVHDSEGNSGSDTVQVNVGATCTGLSVSATATPLSGTRPLNVAFTATPSGGASYTYLWNFGDSAGSTLQNPNHIYNTAGTYNVNVTVWSGSNVAVSNQITIVVSNPGNVTQITISGSCSDAEVDEDYTCDINANGPGTITFTLTDRPSGMTINSTTGVISWTPDETGSFDFTVRASNGVIYSTRTFTIDVNDDESDSNGDDLNVEGIDFEAETVQQGTELVALVTLENTGDYDMDDLTVQMEIEDLNVESASSKFNLNDGDKETIEVSLDLPSKVSEGYYTVKFTIENDDFTVTKYREVYVKGTKLNVQPTSTNVVTQNNIQGYSAPAGKSRLNWFGIWFILLLFILLLALTIYLARKAMKKEEKVQVTSLDEMI